MGWRLGWWRTKVADARQICQLRVETVLVVRYNNINRHWGAIAGMISSFN